MSMATIEQQILDLDLEIIKVKLIHKSGENWTKERSDDAEAEYKKFLTLCAKYPTLNIGLTVEADIFWHYHILNTKKYTEDCKTLFGGYMHHDPTLIDDTSPLHIDAAQNFFNLYKENFGEIGNRVLSDTFAASGRIMEPTMAASGRIFAQVPALAASGRIMEPNMAASGRIMEPNE